MIHSGTNDNVRLNYCEAENFSSLQQFVILICIPPPYRAPNTHTKLLPLTFPATVWSDIVLTWSW